jgi:hypothetical protein
MNLAAGQFAELFRAEHRAIRDALLRLLDAIRARDRKRIRRLLEQTAEIAGPHFRYAEEAVYPALTGLFDPEQIQKLQAGHDRAIAAMRRLAQLTAKPLWSGRDTAEASRLVCAMLPHLSDCDGVALMVERLPVRKLRAILQAREQAHRVGLDVLQWAELIRKRKP